MLRSVREGELHKLGAKLVGPLFIVFAIFYFIFHVLSGEHGVYALLRENRRLELLQAELGEVVDKRKLLEHRVQLMGSGSLDLDLLDEQSRSLLGVAGENELVIPLKK